MVDRKALDRIIAARPARAPGAGPSVVRRSADPTRPASRAEGRPLAGPAAAVGRTGTAPATGSIPASSAAPTTNASRNPATASATSPAINPVAGPIVGAAFTADDRPATATLPVAPAGGIALAERSDDPAVVRRSAEPGSADAVRSAAAAPATPVPAARAPESRIDRTPPRPTVTTGTAAAPTPEARSRADRTPSTPVTDAADATATMPGARDGRVSAPARRGRRPARRHRRPTGPTCGGRA